MAETAQDRAAKRKKRPELDRLHVRGCRGLENLAGRRFVLRRVAFPPRPVLEWFVVDLFENADGAGVAPEDLAAALQRAVAAGQFDTDRLREMAKRYGTRRTRLLVERALAASAP